MTSEGYYLIYLRKDLYPTFGEVFIDRELCITDQRGREYAVGFRYFMRQDNYTLEPLFPATAEKLAELEIILQDSVNVLERRRAAGPSISWKENQEIIKVWKSAVEKVSGLVAKMRTELADDGRI